MATDDYTEQLVFKCSTDLATRLRADADEADRSLAGQIRVMLTRLYAELDATGTRGRV